MIHRNASPEGTCVAFIGKRGGDFRARLIAVCREGDQAIVQVLAGPTSGGAETGALILVRESPREEWAREVRAVEEIPRGWRMMLALQA